MSKPESLQNPARFRPPDFLLPQSDGSLNRRRRAGEPEIYLTWGGQVYGPTGPEEILAGLRAASFEPDAQFWLEGQPEWRPVSEFDDLVEYSTEPLPLEDADTQTDLAATKPDQTPSASTASTFSREKRHRRRRTRQQKAAKTGKRGLLFLALFLALGIAATVGLLWLLMFI